MNARGKIYTVCFTFVVAFLFVLILTLVNYLVQDRLAFNLEVAKDTSILRAAGVAFTSDADAVATFQTAVTRLTAPGDEAADGEYYLVRADGRPVYVGVRRGQGLWGSITVALAIPADADRIAGLEIVAHNETPGLGGRIDEPWFKDQFRGEALSPDGRLILGAAGPGDTDRDNAKIDAVTGATSTSRLLLLLVNDTLERLRRVAANGAGGNR